MDVLQPFVPLGNSGTVPWGRRLESALVRLRGGGKWWVLHSFSWTRGACLRGDGCLWQNVGICDFSVWGCGGGRVSPCGVWGRGGVTMRLLGVETSIKTTKNTTRTDSIITLQHQNPSKHECNLTNKQTNKDQRNKDQRNKQTKIKETSSKERKKETNKHTNKQRSKKQRSKKQTNKDQRNK